MVLKKSLLLATLAWGTAAWAQDPQPADDTTEESDETSSEEETESTSEDGTGIEVSADTNSRTLSPYMEERLIPMPTAGAVEEKPAEEEAPKVEEAAPPETPAEQNRPTWETIGESRDITRGEYLAELEDDDLVDLAVKKKVLPQYPNELEVLYGDRAIRCTARVWVDDKGKPQRVAMVRCADGFRLAAASALTRWRWEIPDGMSVPSQGLEVEAELGFLRKERKYYPGVTYLFSPEQVTADPEAPALLRSGTMPEYPAQVSHGDAVCRVELTVTDKGKSKDILIDECPSPHRNNTVKAIKKWKWYAAGTAGGGDGRESNVVVHVSFNLARTVGRNQH